MTTSTVTPLNEGFEQLLDALRARHQTISPTGEQQVFYLVFEPARILDVRRRLKPWQQKLRDAGFKTARYSFAKRLPELADAHPTLARSLPLEAASTRSSAEKFRDAARLLQQVTGATGDKIVADLREVIARQDANTVLLLTDVECLHPAVRIGALENQLLHDLSGPVVILYPGRRTAKYALRFLDIYPEDGNYRSTHFECAAA